MFGGNTNYPLYRKKIAQQCSIELHCLLITNDRPAISRSEYGIYVNSTFFFCLGGNTGPHTALFDGLAVNSISVIFEEVLFDVTYPSFFTGHTHNYSIFLNTSVDVMGQLRDTPSWRIAELQRNIARVRNLLLYLPNSTSFDATWVMMQELKQYQLNEYKFID